MIQHKIFLYEHEVCQKIIMVTLVPFIQNIFKISFYIPAYLKYVPKHTDSTGHNGFQPPPQEKGEVRGFHCQMGNTGLNKVTQVSLQELSALRYTVKYSDRSYSDKSVQSFQSQLTKEPVVFLLEQLSHFRFKVERERVKCIKL